MDMKFALKLIAASLALASAGQASATIADYNTVGSAGSGEMFMAVWDSVAQKSYIRDLGIHMNDFMPALGTGTAFDKTTIGTAVGTAAPYGGTGTHSVGFSAGFGATPSVAAGSVLTPGYSLNFAADSTLTSFLGSAGSLPTSLQWMVGTVDNTGSTGVQTNRALTTSNGAVDTSGLNNSQLSGFTTTAGYISENNGKSSMGTLTSQNGSATAVKADGNSYFDTLSVGSWGLNAPFSNLAHVGTAQKFWYLGTSSSSNPDKATVKPFTNASWNLDTAGNLSYTVAAVPEADTWAMLLAGLGLMGVIARRRLQG